MEAHSFDMYFALIAQGQAEHDVPDQGTLGSNIDCIGIGFEAVRSLSRMTCRCYSEMNHAILCDKGPTSGAVALPRLLVPIHPVEMSLLTLVSTLILCSLTSA